MSIADGPRPQRQPFALRTQLQLYLLALAALVSLNVANRLVDHVFAYLQAERIHVTDPLVVEGKLPAPAVPAFQPCGTHPDDVCFNDVHTVDLVGDITGALPISFGTRLVATDDWTADHQPAHWEPLDLTKRPPCSDGNIYIYFDVALGSFVECRRGEWLAFPAPP